MNLLTTHGLSQRYGSCADARPALNNLNVTLSEGETTALVGRSGCGKSTLARLLVGLERPSAGSVHYRGQPIATLNGPQRNAFRRDVQLVFQDAFSAVNPRLSIVDIVAEPLRHLTNASRRTRREQALHMVEAVGLNTGVLMQRPAQLSGGQLQRVCLARALIVGPRFVILDEAVSNLDSVMQGQILALLKRLRHRMGTAFLFITHDLRPIAGFCQRVIVMEKGEVVEEIAASTDGLRLRSRAGQALQQAILPALPRGRCATVPGRNV